MTYPAQLLVLALLYAASGWIGLQLDAYHTHVTLIWPPTGLSLAALILYGRRMWPGVLIGCLALNTFTEIPFPIGIALAIGNTLEALVGSYLMIHYFDFRPTLARVRDVAVLLFVGGMFATIISAGNGVTVLWLSGRIPTGNVLPTLMTWWLGDFGAVFVLAPFLMLLRTGSPDFSSLIRNPEFWMVTSFLIVACILAFGGFASTEAQRVAMQFPLPCLAWAGIRLGTRGAAFVSFSTIATATVATSQGLGPLAASDTHVSMIFLWTYGFGLGATVLSLAAAVAQRNKAEDRQLEEVEQRQRSEREQLLLHERERIMREMHDGLGGQLVSVLSMVQRGNASDDEVAEALRRSLDDMRIVIDSLETRESSFQELLGKLRARLEPLLQRNGLDPHWRVDDDALLDALDPEQALHSVRIIQEATANVIQHAQATNVYFEISATVADTKTLTIEIRDDGIGVTPGSKAGGRGTRNMIARAQALGATLRIESANPGTRIRLAIPTPRHSSDDASRSD